MVPAPTTPTFFMFMVKPWLAYVDKLNVIASLRSNLYKIATGATRSPQ